MLPVAIYAMREATTNPTTTIKSIIGVDNIFVNFLSDNKSIVSYVVKLEIVLDHVL